MMLYSCDHGSTVVDNFDERFLDEERELQAEVWDILDDSDQDPWSGQSWDYWTSNSSYQRPNIFV